MSEENVEAQARRDVGAGVAWSSIPYACAGVFMIIVGRVWATMPLNSPGVWNIVGFFDRAIGMRVWSILLFALGIAVLVSGLLYRNRPGRKSTVMYARVVAILQQPWLGLPFLVIAGAWFYMLADPDSSFASEIALTFHGLDIEGGGVPYYDFVDILKSLPSLELLFIGIGLLAISPVTMHAGAMLLQDSGLVLNKKRRVNPQPVDQKFRMYAVKGLFTGGIFFLVVAFAIFAIGLVMGLGIDALYPFVRLESYPLFKSVYWIPPAAIGLACMATSIVYYLRPASAACRTMAWVCACVQLVLPVHGWYVGIHLLQQLKQARS